MTDTVLKTIDLSKVYKTNNGAIVANDKINLNVKRGEFVAFVGPNGSGKTTLIKQIIGYTNPTAGHIELFGEPISEKGTKDLGRIGYMMQSRYAHWDHLRARDAIYYSGRLKNLSKRESESQRDNLAASLNLSDDLGKTLETMSGGKKQAVSLACAVIGNPELIILDEPTNALDPEMKRLFWEFISQLSAKENATILLVTHNLDEVERVADEVKVFSNAKIVTEGNPREMIKELYNKVRLELIFKEGAQFDRERFLDGYEKKWSGETLFVYVPQPDVASSVKEIFSNEKTGVYIDNLQMSTPTLEDVYIKLVGMKII
jgi:ABC-2 type transport system ATP-binding protein